MTIGKCAECGQHITWVQRRYTCLGCDKIVCFDCSGTMKEYVRTVHSFASVDGWFCHDCDSEPPTNVTRLHSAYRQIESLRKEKSEWYIDYKKRADSAESLLFNVKRLVEKEEDSDAEF